MQHEDVLNSWKEIAEYLGRGVRTAQRWERSYMLPVHRPAGKDRASVFALKTEIDTWQKRCPVHVLTLGAANDQPAIMDSAFLDRVIERARYDAADRLKAS